MPIAKSQSVSPGCSSMGPKHHVYPNTSPPKRNYYPPTPDITPDPSLRQHTVAVLEADAPLPLDLPLSLSQTRSQESHHGSPTVSPSPSSQPSTSSSTEAIASSIHRNTASSIPDGFGDYLEKSIAFGGGQALPFAIEEEDEPETPSSSSIYSTNSAARSGVQREMTKSSLSVSSKDRSRPSLSKRSFKGRSFRKRIKRIFGGSKGGFKGGNRVQI